MNMALPARATTSILLLATCLAPHALSQPYASAFQGSQIALLDERMEQDSRSAGPAWPLSSDGTPAPTGPVTVGQGSFFAGGKRISFIGGNWSGLGEGRGTFGRNAWLPNVRGFASHRDELRAKLREFSSNGVNLIRMWLLDCFADCGASGALVWMLNPGTGDHAVNGEENVKKAIENMRNWRATHP